MSISSTNLKREEFYWVTVSREEFVELKSVFCPVRDLLNFINRNCRFYSADDFFFFFYFSAQLSNYIQEIITV